MTEEEVFAATVATVALADDATLLALIERIVARDEDALTRLYDDTAARVWAVVLRFAQHAALAEEVVDDVYWQVWREAPRFDPAHGRPLAWLLTIARERAIDALRRERRAGGAGGAAATQEQGDAPLSDPAAQPPEALAFAHEARRLHTALARLDAPERELIALAFLRGLTHEEIALKTALPPRTVRSRIRRALLKLRQELSPAAAAGGPKV